MILHVEQEIKKKGMLFLPVVGTVLQPLKVVLVVHNVRIVVLGSFHLEAIV